MVVTLLGCMWVLHRLEKREGPPTVIPADTTRSAPALPQEEAKQVAVPAPIEVSALPLVALDNTCYYDGERDFSRCTGAISGGPVREYVFQANGKDTYYIGAEPRSDYFDLSLVLFDNEQQCIIGQDDNGPGFREAAVIKQPAAGLYSLYVGGYAEDCGPFELILSTKAPNIAQVTKTGSTAGRNGTVVRWETFAEVDLAHFELFRQNGSNRERIATLRAHGSPAGFAVYRFTDRQPLPDSNYVIESVSKDGRRETVVAG